MELPSQTPEYEIILRLGILRLAELINKKWLYL